MAIEKPKELKKYYKDKNIVDKYIDKRFKQPIHTVEHKKQVGIINNVIKKNNCKNILEIACGPARLTTEVKAKDGISIDSSEEMLKLARKRMKKIGKKWTFKKADAFNLSFKKNYFDLVFSFKFIYHFKKEGRYKIYKQINNTLKSGGFLIFDAINKRKATTIRKIVGKKRYIIYDKLYKKKELEKELDKNGFRIIALNPVINHFWFEMLISRLFSFFRLYSLAEYFITITEEIKSAEPYEWVVLCQKK